MQQGQVPDLSNVDLTHAKDIVCDECGNKGIHWHYLTSISSNSLLM